MATTNLNLTTIAGTDNPANFPATYNDALGKIDAFAGNMPARKSFSFSANSSKAFTASGALRCLLLTYGTTTMLGMHMIARNNTGGNAGLMYLNTIASAGRVEVAVTTNTITLTSTISATTRCEFIIFDGDIVEATT